MSARAEEDTRSAWRDLEGRWQRSSVNLEGTASALLWCRTKQRNNGKLDLPYSNDYFLGHQVCVTKDCAYYRREKQPNSNSCASAARSVKVLHG